MTSHGQKDCQKHYSLMLGWPLILGELGTEPRTVLRHAGLPEDLFTRAQARLAPADYHRLWSSIEELTGDPAFALGLLARDFPAEAFDPPIFAAFCSPDLVTAVARIARFKALLGPLTLEISRPDGDLRVTLCCEDEAALPRSLVIAELAFFLYLGRRGTRRPIEPVEVTAPGDYGALGALTDYFGRPVTAGPRISVRIAADDARRPFLTANAGMWQVFEPELQRRLADLEVGEDMSARVRSALLELLPAGASSIEAVAERLAVSKRTLQRRLRDEDTNYQAVLGAVRERLAKHYLTRTTIRGAEIAFLLGFDDPNSFYRAFQGWTGKTPEALRASSSTGVAP
jgi:AraC-like DNA-binding protein